LNIESGKAKIEFRIDVELSDEEVPAADTAEQEVDEKKEGVSGDDEATVNADIDEDVTDKENSESKDAAKSDVPDINNDEDKAADPHVVLVLDASLYWTPDSNVPRSGSPQCYPFVMPIAIIKSGCYLFSGGSTIQDGDEVNIDLDWTPSIHLADAATNISLKIRECLRRGEPLHPAVYVDDVEDGGISGSLMGLTGEALLREAREAKESLLETKKVVGATMSAASKTMTKGLFSLGESLSKFAEASTISRRGDDGEEDEESREETEVAERVVKAIPDIGDTIDLSMEPWSHCIGMYSCKAIKRPAFVEDAIADAAKNKVTEVSGI
jgi:hypothetical protein